MASFQQAMKRTLIHEGGFQNNPKDHANWSSGKIGEGELIGTKYGITAISMPGVDIKNITPEIAAQFYQGRYWKDLYSQIDSQVVAEKLFDLGILFWVNTVVKVMQLTLNIKADGLFGPSTLAEMNSSEEKSLLQGFQSSMMTHCFKVAEANPVERGFLRGWGYRINCSLETPCPSCKGVYVP